MQESPEPQIDLIRCFNIIYPATTPTGFGIPFTEFGICHRISESAVFYGGKPAIFQKNHIFTGHPFLRMPFFATFGHYLSTWFSTTSVENTVENQYFVVKNRVRHKKKSNLRQPKKFF